MATTVGQLTIEMAANIVRLQQDMDNAKRTVSSAMTSIERAADKAANTLSLIGVSLSGAAIGMFVKSAIDAADKLDDLSKKTGLLTKSKEQVWTTMVTRMRKMDFAWLYVKHVCKGKWITDIL